MLKSSYQIKETMLENIIQHKNPKFIKYVLCILYIDSINNDKSCHDTVANFSNLCRVKAFQGLYKLTQLVFFKNNLKISLLR
jgi:hypothetical protein